MVDCETCRDVREVETTADRLLFDRERGWWFPRVRIPCPDCTAEGAALIEAEADALLRECRTARTGPPDG